MNEAERVAAVKEKLGITRARGESAEAYKERTGRVVVDAPEKAWWHGPSPRLGTLCAFALYGEPCELCARRVVVNDTFPTRLVPQETEARVFLIDGVLRSTWQEMSAANDDDIMADLDVLAVGEVFTVGGGAGPEQTVKRIA